MASDGGRNNDRRFQQLTVRENSTLVLSTVASSLSLALFVGLVTYEANRPVRDALFLSGLLFVACSYLYRELTIHIKDFKDSDELGLLGIARTEWSKMIYPERFWVALRMWLVRFFLLIPTVAYVTYGYPTLPLLLSVLFVIALALAFCAVEIARVYDP